MNKIKYCIFSKIHVSTTLLTVPCALISTLLCLFISSVIMREGSYDEPLKINFYSAYDYLFFSSVFGEAGIGIDGRDLSISART